MPPPEMGADPARRSGVASPVDHHGSGIEVNGSAEDRLREARELDRRIDRTGGDWVELLAEARRTGTWITLGFASWAEYFVTKVDAARRRIPVAERLEIFGPLRDDGLSNREIASAVGVSPSTVDRVFRASNDAATEVPKSTGSDEGPDEDAPMADARPEPGTPKPTKRKRVQGFKGSSPSPGSPNCKPHVENEFVDGLKQAKENIVHFVNCLRVSERALRLPFDPQWKPDSSFTTSRKNLIGVFTPERQEEVVDLLNEILYQLGDFGMQIEYDTGDPE